MWKWYVQTSFFSLMLNFNDSIKNCIFLFVFYCSHQRHPNSNSQVSSILYIRNHFTYRMSEHARKNIYIFIFYLYKTKIIYTRQDLISIIFSLYTTFNFWFSFTLFAEETFKFESTFRSFFIYRLCTHIVPLQWYSYFILFTSSRMFRLLFSFKLSHYRSLLLCVCMHGKTDFIDILPSFITSFTLRNTSVNKWVHFNILHKSLFFASHSDTTCVCQRE